MSGIVGLFNLAGKPVDPDDISRMLAAIAHRGPDGMATWTHEAVGLGHCMLWSTPESLTEELPLVQRDGALAITADARLDNRAELIDRLGLGRQPATTLADSTLILAAYERWGEQCPAYLLGDFAFAIWDGSRRRVFLARDPFGVRPLYYCYQPNQRLVFGSEIKALKALVDVPRRLNEVQVAFSIIGVYDDKRSTFYQDIQRLPPAHRLTVSAEKTELRKYWSLDTTRELRLGSNREYAEAFRTTFIEAVRCRMRSAYPVGSMLSGGLDSSAITCVARDLACTAGQGPWPTFSAIYPELVALDPRIDERPYMQAVVDTGGIAPTWVEVDRYGPLAGLLWHDDEPLSAPNLILDYAIFGVAARQGIRVILSGHDGDSTVSHGYEHLANLARTLQLRRLLQEVRVFDGTPPWTHRRILWHYGLRHLVPRPLSSAWAALRGRGRTPIPRAELINPDLARRVELQQRLEAFDWLKSQAQTAQEEHWQDITSGLLVYCTEMLEATAAARGLEVRLPFFDRRLVELCVALPADQKLSQGWTRLVLRRAMYGTLPELVRNRVDKGNLSIHSTTRLRDREWSLVAAIIPDGLDLVAPFVNLETVRAASERYATHPTQHSSVVIDLLTVVSLGHWLRRPGVLAAA